MTQRAAATEANKSGSHAVEKGKHRKAVARLRPISSAKVLRRPPQYSDHDIDLLLVVFYQMFTETQSRKLRVALPWDDSAEPETMMLADVAALLESWLE